MLSLFRNNQFLGNLMLLPYLLLLRWPAFVGQIPAIEIPDQSIFCQSLFEWIQAYPTLAQTLVAILILVHAWLINALTKRYNLDESLYKLAGLMYIFITSCFRDFHILSTIIVANTFLIIALYQSFETYKRKSCFPNIFNVGMWLGVASLVHFPYIAFAIAGFMGIMILRSPRIQEWLTYLLGVFLPFFLTGVWHYWHGSTSWLTNVAAFSMPQWLTFIGKPSLITYAALGFFGVAIALAIASFGVYYNRKVIGAQRYISILYWFLLASGLTLLLQRGVHLSHLLVCSVPLSIFVGMSFAHMNRQAAEFLHVILIMAAYALYFMVAI